MSGAEFEVLWAEAAARDLEEIVGYIAQDSPARATYLLARLKARALSLAATPNRGRIVPELRGFGLMAWRELVVRPYRLIYRVSGKQVRILAVLDGRRDLEDLLLERLLR